MHLGTIKSVTFTNAKYRFFQWESTQSGILHEREIFLHRFKLVMQICHIDQQKTAWFESDSIDTIDNKQWTLFACEVWVI